VQCLYSVEPQLRFIRLVWMEDFEWILCVSDKVLFISDNSVCVLWTCPVPSWQSGLKELWVRHMSYSGFVVLTLLLIKLYKREHLWFPVPPQYLSVQYLNWICSLFTRWMPGKHQLFVIGMLEDWLYGLLLLLLLFSPCQSVFFKNAFRFSNCVYFKHMHFINDLK